MLATFSFKMPRALNVEWMPPKLTASVVSMSVKSAYHELEVQLAGTLSKTAVV
jgi:hypothetical protein